MLKKVCLTLFVFLANASFTHAQDRTTEELRHLSIEELLNTDVTTASRLPTTNAMAPAAVYVITQERIRRSGATTLPEVLRLAPGVQVSQMDANRWAIGIRGFPDRLARSMLVLIDGRAIYSPLFAGTYWEVQDVLLEDIDRIEVIRGPGGTLWGANAVNGIINIITKNAAATQGLLIQGGGGGPEARGTATVRFGGSAGQNLKYRVYGIFNDRKGTLKPAGADLGDWRMGQAGFRSEWSLPSNQSLTLQGDLYSARDAQAGTLASFDPPYNIASQKRAPLAGGNLLARWSSPWKAGSDIRLQVYYDRTSRDDLALREVRNTLDIDFQNALPARAGHQLVWGLGSRISADDTHAVPTQEFLPAARRLDLFTAFVQDDVQLTPQGLRLMLGSKFERNDYSGFEVQPGARLVWNAEARHTFLVSVSRALRTPTRVERDYVSHSVVNPQPTFIRLIPNEHFQPEKLVAYEAGYRVRPVGILYLTMSAFFNQHDDLLSTEVSTPFVETTAPGASRVILPLHWMNNLHGSSRGIEVTGDFRPLNRWRWTGTYSNLTIQLTPDPNTSDLTQQRAGEGNSPHHQVQLESSIDLSDTVDFDWSFRYISQLKNLNIPAYATSDLRLAWRPTRNLELSVVGKNLHDPSHPEFSRSVEIPRSVYGQFNLSLR